MALPVVAALPRLLPRPQTYHAGVARPALAPRASTEQAQYPRYAPTAAGTQARRWQGVDPQPVVGEALRRTLLMPPAEGEHASEAEGEEERGAGFRDGRCLW